MNVTSTYWRQLYLYLKRERRRQMRAHLRALAAQQVDALEIPLTIPPRVRRRQPTRPIMD